MNQRYNKKLVLENGKEFYGNGFGANKESVFELVFNTSMVGYDQILSDPSYFNQGVVMTYPLIGNYGFNEDVLESDKLNASALIVKEYSKAPSHYTIKSTIEQALVKYDIPGLYDVDTRELTKTIRDNGSQLAIIVDFEVSTEDAVAKIKEVGPRHDHVSQVSTKEPKKHIVENAKYTVALMDFGYKGNILAELLNRGCEVTVFPHTTNAEEIIGNFDGVMLSNGPGDPQDLPEVIANVKKLIDSEISCFGICLGHQLTALAIGATTKKLKFGHRGANQPVLNIDTNKVEITSQNHSYYVDETSLPAGVVVTHKSLNDETIEGLRVEGKDAFCVQYHPESCPGPQDSGYLFDQFIQNMEVKKNA